MDIADKQFMLNLHKLLPSSTLEVYQKYFPNFGTQINQVKMALGEYKNNISTFFTI